MSKPGGTPVGDEVNDDTAGGTATGGLSRRAALSSAAGLTVATSGCLSQFRSIVNRDDIDPLSVTITTLPADGDRETIRLAREVANALESAGIESSVEMRSSEEFLRAVLINHDFDIYVGEHPGGTDPDFLYEALHSRYADESGWQNPFGMTNLLLDELLEDQREANEDDREGAVESMLDGFVAEQPFIPICTPTEHRLARADRYDDWTEGHLATRSGYLGLEPRADEHSEHLRTVHTDARPSQNLNPLTVEYRYRDTIIDLVYDSLATDEVSGDGEQTFTPWLAEEWEWEDESTLVVSLHTDCTFHDGEPLTAEDVEFTYQFLSDTANGDGSAPAPSPRYRGLVSAIDDVEASDNTVEFTIESNQTVGERALTVPIFPEHVWEDRSEHASVRGVRVAQGTTDAVVSNNIPPVGSGPFQYADHTDREHVTFDRFDDHFTLREAVDLPEPTVDELRVQIDPRSTSAIQLIEDGDADVTGSALETYVVDDIEETDDVQLLESPSWSFYHLGFNTRNAPFSNPRFRQAVAQLLDKEWLTEVVFDGYAEPIATPLTDEEWLPEDLEWDGEDPAMPFLGTDGDVDVDAAQAAFEDAGFRYGEDGTLRVRH